MNKKKVKGLLQLSWNEERNKYINGFIEEEDHQAFIFLWSRIQYRLSETDNRYSWISRTFDKYGYDGCIERINKIRLYWGFPAIK